ncbi:MAG: hypothetical protein ACLUPD_06980 [Anaerotignum faecicola]
MKHSVFMTTAYGFAVLLISVIILGIIAPKKKKNNADCHAQKKNLFCETYLRDICVCEGSWHLAMSFFCYHFPFGETQKA